MQETFLSAYRALSNFDGRSSFSTWAHRIAVNLTLNHLKRKGREKGRTSFDENVAVPERPAPATDVARWRIPPDRAPGQARLARSRDLPPIYRAAFTLVVLQGMSHGGSGRDPRLLGEHRLLEDAQGAEDAPGETEGPDLRKEPR